MRRYACDGATDLLRSNFAHLLEFFCVVFDRLIEEEIGDARLHAMGVAREQRLQTLKDAIRCHAPTLGEVQGEEVRMPAAYSWRPLPSRYRLIYGSTQIKI